MQLRTLPTEWSGICSCLLGGDCQAPKSPASCEYLCQRALTTGQSNKVIYDESFGWPVSVLPLKELEIEGIRPSWTLPYMSLPLADFNLLFFPYNHEYNSFQWVLCGLPVNYWTWESSFETHWTCNWCHNWEQSWELCLLIPAIPFQITKANHLYE